MDWSSRFGPDTRPTEEDISEYIGSGLWQELHSFIQGAYQVLPKYAYSGCSMQKGWNVKYQKSGRSLCTLYPMQGYFIALVVMGERELPKAELLLPICGDYVRSLFMSTRPSMGGRWLMIDVKDSQTLEDVKTLITIRAKS